MSLTITQAYVDINGTALSGLVVTAVPTASPLFINFGGTYKETSPGMFTATTDGSGIFSLVLPYPSVCSPSSVQWVVAMPDGTQWIGTVPETAGPLTLKELEDSHGWTLLRDRPGITVATGPPGPAIAGPQGAQGPTGTPVWKGAWSGATAYVFGDAVSSGGSSYVCKLAHTNFEPPNSTYWTVLAQKGADGATGPAGTAADATTTTVGVVEVDHAPSGSHPIALTTDGTAMPASLLGTSASKATAGNDARLSDARTPTTHATSHEPGGSDELFGLTDAQIAAANKDGVAGTASLRTLGTGAQQATAGNDTRLSNARTPTVHESTHEAGGSDAFPWSTINGSGTDAGKPAAGSTNSGYLWHATDTKKVYKSNGSVWSVVLDASGTGISTTLAGDTDVSLSSPVESDLLTFDTGTGKWRNRRPLSPNVDATVLEGDLLYRHNKTSLVVGFIGDSLTLDTPTSGLPPPNNAATDLSVGGLTVSQNNQGVSGTTSVTWLPTDISGNFTTAKAAFLSFGVSIVHIMLGTNDSRISERVTQAGYKANLAVICANLNAAGMICVLSYPPYAVPGSLGGDVDATSLTLLQQYEVAIDQLVNGTTIRQGDTTAYNYFAAHTSEFSDGVHPTATGSSHLGQFWATALTPVVTSDLSPLALGAAGTFLTSNGTAPVYRILATSDLPVGTGTRIAMQSGSVAPPVPLWTTAGDDYVYLTPGTP